MSVLDCTRSRTEKEMLTNLQCRWPAVCPTSPCLACVRSAQQACLRGWAWAILKGRPPLKAHPAPSGPTGPSADRRTDWRHTLMSGRSVSCFSSTYCPIICQDTWIDGEWLGDRRFLYLPIFAYVVHERETQYTYLLDVDPLLDFWTLTPRASR